MIQTVKKLALSTFVIGTFAVYALHENKEGNNALSTVSLPSSSSLQNAAVSPAQASRPTTNNIAQSGAPVSSAPQQQTQNTNNNVQTNNVRSQPPAPRQNGMYQDGQYTGPITDAYYGNVQVKAIIQNGRLADVQFLDYPRDRRTSQWINQQATPWLTQEAVQAQSANVNIISGATLTSEAFIQSLGAALNQARG
jgi:uncharacterized protein with FMN-binding domain